MNKNAIDLMLSDSYRIVIRTDQTLEVNISNKGNASTIDEEKLLAQLGMITSNRSIYATFDRDLLREQSYNRNNLHLFVQENTPKLLQELKIVSDTIIQVVANPSGGLCIGPGGTGKTFLISIIQLK
ncbi:hypothetical protein NPIL_609291 [Nephila pilipes]|uniref:ATP-dependent DNA helicase n=1 Tax=Nephila pilipes TaxID=299642 RepID=A0A8X6T277_NEPPI|nr:hypothetical protein NPIL_609291 [Nephila pilipes]